MKICVSGAVGVSDENNILEREKKKEFYILLYIYL